MKEELSARVLSSPFPHLIIENFYNKKELDLIWEEIKFLTKPGKLLPPEDYGGIDDVYGYYSHNTTAIIGLNGSSDYVKFQAYGHNDDNSNPSLVGDSNYGQYTSAFGYLLEAT